MLCMMINLRSGSMYPEIYLGHYKESENPPSYVGSWLNSDSPIKNKLVKKQNPLDQRLIFPSPWRQYTIFTVHKVHKTTFLPPIHSQMTFGSHGKYGFTFTSKAIVKNEEQNSNYTVWIHNESPHML